MSILLDVVKKVAAAAISSGQLALFAEWLRYFGYTEPGMTEEQVQEAIVRFQQVNGLPADGRINADDMAFTQLPRCGNNDVEMLVEGAEALCEWPPSVPLVRWHLGLTPSVMSKTAWRDCFVEACKRWSDVCGLRFEQATDQTQANLLVTAGREDGPSGTLAWCELPCFGGSAAVRVLTMKLDSQERWGSGIDPVAVVCHELGHGIGISHVKPSLGKALMNPTYDPTVTKPMPLDVEQAVLRYGPPTVTPLPVPPGGLGQDIRIVLEGVGTYEGKVQKVGA